MSPKSVPWTPETRPDRVQCWCFLCNSAHRFGEPCFGQQPGPEPLPACEYCGDPIPKSSNRKTYCRALCRDDAKAKRRREVRACT